MLTSQQKKYAQEWINKRDAKKAAITAGVPAKLASKIGKEWLEAPEIKKYINDEIDKSAVKAKVTRDWIIDEAVKVLQRTVRDDVKLQALGLLDKLLTKKEETGGENTTPTIQIVSEGGLTIL